ncbi:LysR family transcriptional regulator [Terrarubrum flagellatum]|uniref:LysR family transcriptional regulator n=1 Tax=Terrirubrum flagellatum TaxID=2895980 RepID=UPI003144E316
MLLRQFEYLVALAREKHFGRAAASVNVAQPSLSAGVRELEQELGVLIVERGHRFSGFTEDGERILERARRILAERDALRADVDQIKRGLTGLLRFGVIPTALPVTPQITAPFTARFPGATIRVLSLTSIDIQRGLDQFELDIALTYLDNEPLERVRPKPLYTENYLLLTPSDGPFRDRADVTWAEAADTPLCLLTPDMQNRRIVDSVFKSIGKNPRPAFETNSIINLCTQVGSGLWSSVVPRPLLEAIDPPAGVRALPLIQPEVGRLVGLVTPDRDPPSPLAAALFQSAPRPQFKMMAAL